MIETLIGAGIIAIISIIVVVGITHSQKNKWAEKQEVLKHLIELRSVIAFTQKHRGLCAAYIQGNKTQFAEIQQIEQNITRSVALLDQIPSIKVQERWIGYTDHWQRLVKRTSNLTLRENFEQHSNLITNLIYLFEDIAIKNEFTEQVFKDSPTIHLLWQALPFASEYVGQARAIGVVVAANGVSTGVDKVKLGYLETKIKQLTEKVFTELESNKFGDPEKIQMLNAAKELTEQFTQLIHSDLIEVDQVTVSAQTYFEAASLTMNAINRILDSELQTLKEYITQSY